MSGRTRVTLADGRRVTGYRKTLRRQAARTPAHEMPPWRLVLILPTQLNYALSPGATGLANVTVRSDRTVEIEGARWEWVYEQAAKFLATIGKDFDGILPESELTRGAEPPLTLSGPPQARPIKRVQRVILVSRPSVIFLREARDPVIIAA